MRRVKLLACLAMTALLAVPLYAEQQVTLKNGAALIGEVAFDGDALIITIDGSKQRVALGEVASVAPVNFGPDRQANRLLMAALEARILGGAPREAVSLLAEASRLAPDDPQIAYWYASSLVDAGSGKAAERVLEAHRDAIDASYPDRVAKLSHRIKLRLLVEMLPTPLVERIDELNAAAAIQPADAPQRPAFAAFHVLDQLNDPVDQSAFSVQSNGQDERVESFADGYFLVTFLSQRNQGDQTCRLQFTKYGLKSEDVEFRASTDRVALAGQFVVHRFTDADKRPVKVLVVDRDGLPVRGARVELESTSRTGNDAAGAFAALVDDQGRAALSAFPGAYAMTASAESCNTTREQTQIDADEPGGVERQVTMYRRIPATIRVKWTAAPMHPGASEVTTDEGVLEIHGQRGRAHIPALMFLQPMQVQDRLQLNVNPTMFGHGMAMFGGGPWLKKRAADAESDAAARTQAAQSAFDALDLAQVNQLPEEFKPIALSAEGRVAQPGAVRAPAEFGDVFVGRFVSRDARTGQPVDLTFKAIIERPDAPAPEPELAPSARTPEVQPAPQ